MDADTGLRCRLPAHAGDDHAHERGRFTRVAAPGQVSFPRVEQLVAAATAREGGEPGPAWGKGDALTRKGGGIKRTVERVRSAGAPAEVAHA